MHFLSLILIVLSIAFNRLHPASASEWKSAFPSGLTSHSPSPSPSPQAKLNLKQDILARQQKLSEEIERIRGSQSPSAQDQVEFIDALNLVYDQTLESIRKNEDLQQERQSTQEQIDTWKKAGPPKDFPISFSQWNNLSSRLLEEKNRLAALKLTQSTLQDSLNFEREKFKEIEKQRRLLKEDFQTLSEPADRNSMQVSLNEIEAKARLAEATAKLKELEVENEKLNQKISEKNVELIEEKIRWLKEQAHFTQNDLETELAKIDSEVEEINRVISGLRHASEKSERTYFGAQKKWSEAASPPPVALEELEARRLVRERYQTELNSLKQKLQRLGESKSLWTKRFKLLNDQIPKSGLPDLIKEVQQNLQKVQMQSSLAEKQLAEAWTDLNQSEEKPRPSEDLTPEVKSFIGEQQAQLSSIIEIHQENLAEINRTLRLYEQTLAEAKSQVDGLTFYERVSALYPAMVRVWHFELTSVDDRPITVSKVVGALLFFFIGISLSRRVARFFANKVFPRFGLERGVSAGLQTLFFYLLVTLSTMLSLHLVNFPLTLFTVLGGAFAIGIGFGSQNIVKNFISGLILLIEQPIKVGDMIQIEGSAGIVEKIGARSTILRSFENVHSIIPNSDLLEKRVVNSHLQDDLVRTTIKVGVHYSSNCQNVTQCLLRAVQEQEKILKNPEPFVLLTDFSENSIDFELYFWIRIRTLLERKTVESGVRYRIDALFRENQIEFAFPQRDIHLDQKNPIAVYLSNEPKGNSSS